MKYLTVAILIVGFLILVMTRRKQIQCDTFRDEVRNVVVETQHASINEVVSGMFEGDPINGVTIGGAPVHETYRSYPREKLLPESNPDHYTPFGKFERFDTTARALPETTHDAPEHAVFEIAIAIENVTTTVAGKTARVIVPIKSKYDTLDSIVLSVPSSVGDVQVAMPRHSVTPINTTSVQVTVPLASLSEIPGSGYARLTLPRL